MEWRDYKSDMERFQTMTPEEKAMIMKSGLETDFWKMLRASMCNTLKIMEENLIRTRAATLDDTVKLARFAEAYKSVEEIINTPQMFITAATLNPVPRPPVRNVKMKEK